MLVSAWQVAELIPIQPGYVYTLPQIDHDSRARNRTDASNIGDLAIDVSRCESSEIDEVSEYQRKFRLQFRFADLAR